MAGRVRVGTAYIDIKLGSFQEFKQAAEQRARETARSVAKRMTDEINKGVSGKQAGQKVGEEVGQQSAKSLSKFRSAWSNELGLTGKQAAKSFSQAFGVGLRALGTGDLSFFSKAMGVAARDGVTLMGKAFEGVRSQVSKVTGAISTLSPAFASVGNAAKSAFSNASAALGKISSGFETFGRKVGFASFMVQGLGYDLLFLATVPAAALTAAIGTIGIKAAADFEQAKASLAPFVGGLQNAQKEVDTLAKIAAASPAFDTIQIVGYAKSLIAAGLTVKQTNQLFMASSNIFTTLGLSVDQANGAFYAINQIMGKGKVQSEELTQQLAERGVPIWKILSDAMGVTEAKLHELVSQGKVTGVDFVNAMIKAGNSGVYLNGAGVASDTIKAKFANLKEQVQYKLAVAFEKNLFPVLKELIDKYGPKILSMFDNMDGALRSAANKIQTLADAVDKMKAKWDSLSESQKESVKHFLELLIAAGPTILIMTKIGSAMAGLASAAALLTSPVGVVIAILGVLAIALYSIRKPLEAYFKGTEQGKATTAAFKQRLGEVVSFLQRNVFPTLKFLGQVVGAALYGFITGKKDLDGIAGTFSDLRGYIDKVSKVLVDSLAPAWDNIKSSLKDLGINLDDKKTRIKLFFAIVTATVTTVGAVFGVIIGVVSSAITLIAGLFRVITDIVVGAVNIIAGLFKFFKDLLTGDFGKLSADLRQTWDGLWMLIVGTIWDAIITIVDAVTNLVKPIVDLFKWMYDVLVGHSIVPDMVRAIISWIQRLPGAILGAISGLVGQFVQFFVDMKNRAVAAIAELPGRVADKISEAKNAIVARATGFGSLLVHAGGEIIDGLINGISSKIGALKDKLSGIASTIAGYFPGSPVKTGPLKVLNNGYVGATIVQMIADGMGDTSALKASAASAATAALPDFGATGTSGYSNGVLEAGTAGGIVINQTNNIPTPIQDPAELADYSTRRLVSALTTKATQ